MSRRRPDPDDAPEGRCKECGEECRAVAKDMGIGEYEYWGGKFRDVDWRWVSDCCEAEVEE